MSSTWDEMDIYERNRFRGRMQHTAASAARIDSKYQKPLTRWEREKRAREQSVRVWQMMAEQQRAEEEQQRAQNNG